MELVSFWVIDGDRLLISFEWLMVTGSGCDQPFVSCNYQLSWCGSNCVGLTINNAAYVLGLVRWTHYNNSLVGIPTSVKVETWFTVTALFLRAP